MSNLNRINKSNIKNRYQELLKDISNSVDVIILLQGILSSQVVTDVTVSDLSKSLTQNSQSYSDQVKQCYIDYSDIKDDAFRKQLEKDSQMMLKAKINNDFEQYCQCACLQIEAALEYFTKIKPEIYKKFLDEDNYYKDKDIRFFNKKAAYDFWYEETYKKKRKIHDSNYNNISYIMNIRDAASHRTLGHVSFEEKLEKVIPKKNPKKEKTYFDYVIDFYKEHDFALVKKRTENLVRNILINQF